MVTSASPGGSRSASIAMSSLWSSSQSAEVVDLVLQPPLLLEQLVHLVVAHRLGELRRDLVEVVEQLAQVAHAVLDVAADVLGGVELRLLRQVADPGARRAGLASPRKSLSTPAMMRSRVDLPAPFDAEHADLGAGIEGEIDALEDLAGGGHDLSEVAHREDVFAGHRAGKIDAKGQNAEGRPDGGALAVAWQAAGD